MIPSVRAKERKYIIIIDWPVLSLYLNIMINIWKLVMNHRVIMKKRNRHKKFKGPLDQDMKITQNFNL